MYHFLLLLAVSVRLRLEWTEAVAEGHICCWESSRFYSLSPCMELSHMTFTSLKQPPDPTLPSIRGSISMNYFMSLS